LSAEKIENKIKRCP
jgi:hypothetical protein